MRATRMPTSWLWESRNASRRYSTPLAMGVQLLSSVGMTVGGTGEGFAVAGIAVGLTPTTVGTKVAPLGVANEINVGSADPFGIEVGNMIIGVALGSSCPLQPVSSSTTKRVNPALKVRLGIRLKRTVVKSVVNISR